MLLKDETAESAEEDDSDADEEDLDEEEADSSSADADADADEEERTETRSEAEVEDAEVEDAESVLVPLLVVEWLSIRGKRDGRCGSCCRRCWRRESALEVEVVSTLSVSSLPLELDASLSDSEGSEELL